MEFLKSCTHRFFSFIWRLKQNLTPCVLFSNYLESNIEV